ncbi:DUF4350 domain-containing protein [Parerythrobacter aurantius]|uniref:DUF4350 domain-containing protein n=1 Tax=Parerythrobacter aurantius TaxID=3127706 RepID=UPI00324A1A8E
MSVAGTVASPVPAFDKRRVLALVAVGTLAFLALLYSIGTGRMGGNENNGQGHAASNGLNGFSALVRLLEADGREVRISRSEAAADDPVLLVLTPPHWVDEQELGELIARRANHGPTLVILPKWFASAGQGKGARPGWVTLGGAAEPMFDFLVDGQKVISDLGSGKVAQRRPWTTPTGVSGLLPPGKAVLSLESTGSIEATPLVMSDRLVLASQLRRGSDASDLPQGFDGDGDASRFGMAAEEAWRVTVVAEPDLVNNWGIADADRAAAALDLFGAAAGGRNLPIVFDLTTNGLGQSRNLLSLAFEPPFLAATLCLLAALLLVGWRAFNRFGPVLAEAPVLSFGKAQLVENGAGVIQRTGRLHLLTRPYAGLIENRIARRLGQRTVAGAVDRQLLDALLERRGLDPVSPRLAALETARRTDDILRAARALHSLERTLAR